MVRAFSCLAWLLLVCGCHLPLPAQPEPQSPAPFPTISADELNREQFRRGLENLAGDHPETLQRLAQSSPDSIWGVAANQLLEQHSSKQGEQDQAGQLQEQVAELQQQLKTTGQELHKARQKNHELQNKLDELARVLVEQETHAR